MTGYVLSAEAEADLRGIIRYTNKEWGPAQVRRYVATLEKGIDELVAGRGSFHDMSELFQTLGWCAARNITSFVFRAKMRLHWSWRFSMSAWTL